MTVSLKDRATGGFLNDVEATILGISAVMFNYPNNPLPDDFPALQVEYGDIEGADESSIQHYKAGDPARLVASEDGTGFEQVLPGAKIHDRSNAGRFLKAVDTCIAAQKLAWDYEAFADFVGLRVRLATVEIEGGPNGTYNVTVPMEIVGLPDGQAKAVKRPSGKPPVTQAKPLRTAGNQSNVLAEKAGAAVRAILRRTKGGKLPKGKLPQEVFTFLKTDKEDRGQVFAWVSKDTNLKTIEDITFDGKTVALTEN